MLLSGGTTSLSKLIPRTHEDYVLNARLCGRAGGFDEQTVFMAILPLGHNYNLASPGILGAFYVGGTVVLAPSTDTAEIFRLVERERVTVIAAVVPLISAWLASDEPKRFDHSSLKVVQNGGARLAPELRQRLISELGCTPQEIYGTAEGLINMTRLDDPLELILHSSGRPVCEDDEIAVVDDDGRELPDGEAGELITRGPYTIRGYYRAPEKNTEAFTSDGFYRMGDIVRKWGRNIQAEGRRKDLINRGGEKISCEEVENFIHRHPAVKSACLVAMPDPVFGEKACAFVILREGESLTFEGSSPSCAVCRSPATSCPSGWRWWRSFRSAPWARSSSANCATPLPRGSMAKAPPESIRSDKTPRDPHEDCHHRRRPGRPVFRSADEAPRPQPRHHPVRAQPAQRHLGLWRGVFRPGAGVSARRRRGPLPVPHAAHGDLAAPHHPGQRHPHSHHRQRLRRHGRLEMLTLLYAYVEQLGVRIEFETTSVRWTEVKTPT